MKIIRRGIIALLVVALISIIAYRFMGIKEPPQVMDVANLTVQAAPDQTASMENPNFIKEEYVAVLPEGSNIALEGKAEVNNFQDSYSARKVNDGKAVGVSYWEGKANSYPNIITMDLKKAASIHAIRICLNPQSIWGKRTQTFAVQVSSDGVSFQQLIPTKQYTFDPDTGNEVIFSFDAIETQYVQLEFTENSGAGGAQVAEFEIYSK